MKGRYPMIGRIIRMRVGLGMDIRKPLLFLARANEVYTGLDDNKTTFFLSCNPALPVLFGNIQDATSAQQNVGKIKGAATVRDAKFQVLLTSLESECTMVQGLCDASPEQAASLIAAAHMVVLPAHGHQKPILAAKNALPSGSVLLDANAKLLDGTHRRKTFNWRMTLDGEKSFLGLPSTPVGKTTVSGLTPLATVGFQVSVTVNKQPQGPWSQTISILVK